MFNLSADITAALQTRVTWPELPAAIGHVTSACADIGQRTADIILILTDINMICVTDMSHKYFTLYEPNMKTFLYLEPHEIWADPCISPKPLLF